MREINDGGPAFGHGNHEQGGHSGMSLRDWFAGQALAAIIQADGIQYAKDTGPHAIWAYEQADAMLKARESSDA